MKTIPATQQVEVLVDDIDYERLIKHKWYFNGKYVCRNNRKINGKHLKPAQIYLHREIMNPPIGMEVDHKDGNRLNNQRSNLRICTDVENTRNRSMANKNYTGFKGVSLNKKTGSFVARIRFGGKRISLGYYKKPEEAYRAYKDGVLKYHGEFANPN
jgi:hypothetical protein